MLLPALDQPKGGQLPLGLVEGLPPSSADERDDRFRGPGVPSIPALEFPLLFLLCQQEFQQVILQSTA